MKIETERLIIRRFTEEDIDLIFDINNNPECIKFNGWDSMSIEKCKESLEKWINNYSISSNTGAFCVVRCDSYVVKLRGATTHPIASQVGSGTSATWERYKTYLLSE
jgi:RimJ/RimL family protein N-acetyltransferase